MTVEPGVRARGTGRLLLLLALALAAWAMAPEVTSGGPWQRGWLGHNGARYAHIARNHARFGLTTLGGAPLLETAPAAGHPVPWEGREPIVYGHHPPGVTWGLGALFLLTGPDETVARLSAALATIVSLLVLARLVSGVAGPVAGGGAALLLAAMPMTTVYGVHVEVQGPYVLAAFLLVLLAWRHWKGGGSVWPWLAACMVASSLDWFGLYAPAVCALDALLARPRRVSRAVVAGAVTALLFAGWFAYLASLPGMSAGRVLGAAGVRGLGGLEGAPVAEFAKRWWTDVSGLLPLLPLTLAVALEAAWRGVRSALPDEPSALLRQLVLPPVAHALIFPAGMLVHAYWLFALPPALAAGVFVLRGRPGTLARGLLAPAIVVLGVWGTRAALPPADAFPALLGQALAVQTQPGDVVLTNYGTNVLTPGEAGDVHITRLPEVTYYADRPVRGGVGELGESGVFVDLDEALQRRPDARWFVSVTPLGQVPSARLEARLAALCDEPAQELSGEPPVELWRLRD